MSQQDNNERKPRFSIFRHNDARPEDGIPIMHHEPLSETAAHWAKEAAEAGVSEGHENRMLFNAGGFSLLYAWFKSGYPLPRHTHDSDCLYYIVGGSLKIGTEELHAGDGFFVGEDVPYTYTAGPEGVEILEFRASQSFNIDLLANNEAFWKKAIEQVEQRRDQWREEVPPSTIPR